MTLTLKGHVTFLCQILFLNVDVLDIPDDFWEKNFPPYKGSGLKFFGEKMFFDHVTFLVPNSLFVILDVLDIPGEFEGENVFPLKMVWTP